MSVAIRLQRHGSRKKPFYKVVITDSRKKRDGECIERIGHYNPSRNPIEVEIKKDRLDHWIAKGARPSLTVGTLLKKVSKSA